MAPYDLFTTMRIHTVYHLRSLILVVACVPLFAGCADEERKLSTLSPEALTAYHEGLTHWENFYFSEAKSSFERALANDSSFAMAWARLAILNQSTQNEKVGREQIARALDLSRHATLKEQLFIRMWEKRITFKDQEAAAIADSLIVLCPDEPEPFVFRGTLVEQNKNLEGAIKYYQRAVEIDTGYAPAVMLLGYAYSTANEQAKAISAMERYIRLVPGAADPRASYADLLLRVGRYEDALAQYNQSLALKPDYWYALQQIGTVYSIQGRLDSAQQKFREGFNFLPQSEQLDASRLAVDAGLEIQRGRYHEAITLYRNVLVIDSSNINAQFGLVNALTKVKKFDEAKELVERIHQELNRRNLDETGSMQGFHMMRARLALEEGYMALALTECEEALQHSSPLSRPSVFRWIAEIHVREQRYEDAFDACEVALSVNPNSPSALLVLTRVYAALGDAGMTLEIGNRLLALWKDADHDFLDLVELKKILSLQKTKPA